MPGAAPANDNQRAALMAGRSSLPDGAVARIYKPSRSATTSGKARAKGWRMRFEARSAPFIEPLMGWTGSDDPLTQVELSFPSAASAIRYAQRQGLAYFVRSATEASPRQEHETLAARSFFHATLEKLGLQKLETSYQSAVDSAASRSDPPSPEDWASPMDVVRDRSLSLEAKRSILINWAYAEYLADQATNEGMPENGRPSRLDEVEQALLGLEREVAAGAAGQTDAGVRKAA
jgi:hypothetical protein